MGVMPRLGWTFEANPDLSLVFMIARDYGRLPSELLAVITREELDLLAAFYEWEAARREEASKRAGG